MTPAEALREQGQELLKLSTETGRAYAEHNRGRSPERPPRRPDLRVWADAYEASGWMLFRRALELEKEEKD